MDAVHEVLGRSALVSLSATAIALGLGVPVGTWLALGRRRGRGVLATAVNTGMAVPTVVVGLVVALLLWRSGPLGNLELIYTLRGMIIAQVVIAAPLIAGITMAGLQALPPPSGDEAQVQAIISAAQQGLDKLKADPSLITASGQDNPFAEANKLAKQYGLTACAS